MRKANCCGLVACGVYVGCKEVSASTLNAHSEDPSLCGVLSIVKIVGVADAIKKPTKKIMRCNVMTLCPPNGFP